MCPSLINVHPFEFARTPMTSLGKIILELIEWRVRLFFKCELTEKMGNKQPRPQFPSVP